MVIEDAALLNRHVTHMTPPHFSTAVYTPLARLLGERQHALGFGVTQARHVIPTNFALVSCGSGYNLA